MGKLIFNRETGSEEQRLTLDDDGMLTYETEVAGFNAWKDAEVTKIRLSREEAAIRWPFHADAIKSGEPQK